MSRRLILLFGLILFTLTSFAQLSNKNVNTLKLGVEDGLQQSRVDQMVYDNQGILWLKLKNRLQLWDGQNIITVSDSLIENTLNYNIYKHPEDGVLVSNYGTLRRFKYEGLKQELLYTSKSKEYQKERTLPAPIYYDGILHVIEKDSIYDLSESGEIETQKILDYATFENVYSRRILSFSGNKYIQHLQDNNIVDFGHFMEEGITDLITIRWLRNNFDVGGDRLVYTTRSSLRVCNKDDIEEFRFPEALVSEYYTSVLFLGGSKYLIGIDDRIFEFDIVSKTWKHELRNVDNSKLLKSGFFDGMILDKYGDVWAVTVNEGLIKIYLGNDFNFIGTGQTEKNFVKNISVSDTSGLVAISALNNGIFVFDQAGNLLHEINAESTNGKVKSVTGIYEIGYKRYLFNQNNEKEIYVLDLSDNSVSISIIGKKDVEYLYYQDAIPIDENLSLLLFNTLFQFDAKTNQLDTLVRHKSTKSCILLDGDLVWIGANDALIKYNWKHRTPLEYIPMLGEGYIRSVRHFDDNKLVFGSDKGVSIFDKSDYTALNVLGDCTYCLLLDEEHNIWAGTGNGIVKIQNDRRLKRYGLADGLHSMEFNTNACSRTKDGRFFFGGLNGISTFRPEKIAEYNNEQPIIIKQFNQGNREIFMNAMNVSNEMSYKFNHDENNLQFKVGTLGKYEANAYNYQYSVTGLTNGWVDGGDQSNFNFSLSPGTYDFYFASALEYDPEIEIIKPLKVVIQKPWWATWWVYAGFTLFFAGLVAFVISTRNKQEFLKEKYKLDLKINVQEERLNMSKELHDNIGSRLTFLVSSIGNINSKIDQNTEQKVKQLEDFGRDTIDDLRSFMWVLRSDQITIQDLQFKTLDFINIARNTYSNINFHFRGVDPKNSSIILSSDVSQNTFRIIQEGVHNLVKYSDAENAEVIFEIINNMLIIKVVDDGLGFDVNGNRIGYGLGNMKTRATKIGAELKIESEINIGTLIELSLPTISE